MGFTGESGATSEMTMDVEGFIQDTFELTQAHDEEWR